MRIAIMTDTNSGMTVEEARRLDVALLPMPFTIDGEAFQEGRDLSAGQFYAALKRGARVATSQPSPEKYSHTGPEATYRPAKVVTRSVSRWATGRTS